MAKGRLVKTSAPGKTRPVVLFDDAALRQLKEEMLSQSIRQPIHRDNSDPKETISFRIDPLYLRQLSEMAAQSNRSAADVARHLVIQSLETGHASAVLTEIRRVRESLGATFFALLTMKLGSSPEEARRIVADTILKG